MNSLLVAHMTHTTDGYVIAFRYSSSTKLIYLARHRGVRIYLALRLQLLTDAACIDNPSAGIGACGWQNVSSCFLLKF
jgi:hypothetical protein